jgi:hypothetical protein
MQYVSVGDWGAWQCELGSTTKRGSGWVAENGGCIAGCAYPTEKSGLDFRNASIHRLFLSSMNTGIFVPPRIEMTFVKVVVTIGKRWYCRVPLWRKEQASEIE